MHSLTDYRQNLEGNLKIFTEAYQKFTATSSVSSADTYRNMDKTVKEITKQIKSDLTDRTLENINRLKNDQSLIIQMQEELRTAQGRINDINKHKILKENPSGEDIRKIFSGNHKPYDKALLNPENRKAAIEEAVTNYTQIIKEKLEYIFPEQPRAR